MRARSGTGSAGRSGDTPGPGPDDHRAAVLEPIERSDGLTASDYLLSGLLVCGACGKPYIGHGARNNTYQYYSCQTKQKQGAN